MATGAGSLPPSSFATGSAVVNMLRQVGLAVGVALFIAVLGTPDTGHATVLAYRHGSEALAATALLAALIGLVTLRRRTVAQAVVEPAPPTVAAAGAGERETAVTGAS
jgi:hypothetical protein